MLFWCLFTETKASETRTSSNSLGKRRQYADEPVASKHSALQNVNSAPFMRDDWVFPAVNSMGVSQQPILDPVTFSEMPYNHDVSFLESLRPELSEPSPSDQVFDLSVSSQMVPATLVASLPPVSQMFQLIHPQLAPPPTTTITSSQHAAEASVHPLLTMVQQVIPPLQDYSPPMPLSHAVYPSHGSPPTSHQALQPSHHAVDQPAHAASSNAHQSTVPLLITRTSSTRGAKSAPPTPKVIIVSGTGITSATTISGPPPPPVTTSAATKTPPGLLLYLFCTLILFLEQEGSPVGTKVFFSLLMLLDFSKSLRLC